MARPKRGVADSLRGYRREISGWERRQALFGAASRWSTPASTPPPAEKVPGSSSEWLQTGDGRLRKAPGSFCGLFLRRPSNGGGNREQAEGTPPSREAQPADRADDPRQREETERDPDVDQKHREHGLPPDPYSRRVCARIEAKSASTTFQSSTDACCWMNAVLDARVSCTNLAR